MRDARLNLIGEGANDVLRCFIAAVGIRHVGKSLQEVQSAPWTAYKLFKTSAKLPVKHEHTRYFANSIGKQIGRFAWATEMALIKHREGILDQQFAQARLGDIATELFMSSCVYSRLSALLVNGTIPEPKKKIEIDTAMLYMKMARIRNERRFEDLKTNFDADLVGVADQWLEHDYSRNWVVTPDEKDIPQ